MGEIGDGEFAVIQKKSKVKVQNVKPKLKMQNALLVYSISYV
jgi:hypothetical protein